MSLFPHPIVKFTLGLCLLVVLSACSRTALLPQAGVLLNSQNMLNKSAQALVYLSQGNSAFNGVLVSHDGLILSVSLVYNNPEFDIAILQLDDFTAEHFLNLNSDIHENQSVYTMGRHRLSGSLKVSYGRVKTAWINLANMEVSNLNIDNMAVQNAIIHDASIEQGFSGGPLLNAQGELVAINHSILDAKGKSLTIALSVYNFVPLIKDSGAQN